MSRTVEIYVGYGGTLHQLAHRVAGELDLVDMFYSGLGYQLVVDARRWTDEPGWAHLDITAAEPEDEYGPAMLAGTAFAPYNFTLSLEFRGDLDRLGRTIFDRLTRLDLPAAYGEQTWIFADFLPGRGRRDFPPGTDAEGPGRQVWQEPLLHDARQGSPSAPAALADGRLLVFDSGHGSLDVVPIGDDARWARPAVATLIKIGEHDLGQLLEAAAQNVDHGRDDGTTVLATVAARRQLSADEFARRSVCVDLSVRQGTFTATPHLPAPDASNVPGPVVTDLIRRGTAATSPRQLGATVLDLLTAVRSLRNAHG